MTAAAWRWVRGRLRARRRALLAFALLVAIAGGATLTAAAGARRSVDVVGERMAEQRQPDVMSLIGQRAFDWTPIVELPYVEAWGVLAATPLCLVESGGLNRKPGSLCTQPPLEGGWYDSIWRIDVLEGRMPTRPDEIAINRLAQEKFGWRVGDRLRMAGVAPHRLDAFWEGGPRGDRPWGPVYDVEVAAVFRGEETWRVISGGRGHPGFVASAAFMPAHRDELGYVAQAVLRLRDGEHDVPRLRADIAEITGDPAWPIRDVAEARRRVERGARAEAVALALLAVAIAAVGAVLVAQALAHAVRDGAADAPALSAVGMSRRALVPTLAAPAALAGVAGTLGAIAIAVLASPLVPVGMARSFDSRDGLWADPFVLAAGGAAATVAVTALALAVAAAALRRPGPGRGRTRRAPRAPLPPTVALGLRLAFERRPGGTPAPVRLSLAGAAIGVAAVTVALTLAHAVGNTLANPERAGHVWDLVYHEGIDTAVVAGDGDIAAATAVSRATVDVDGLPMSAYGARPIGRPVPQVVVSGRLPATPREVALGPATARTLGAEVGDRVRAGPRRRPVEVVGITLLWEDAGQAAYDEGALLTRAGLARLRPPEISWTDVFVALRPGADPRAVDRRLRAEAGGTRYRGWDGHEAAALQYLRATRKLPVVLAVLFALLGAGALAHGLATTVRRRRRDLAILRALGLSGREVRAALAWQATIVGAVGIAVGLPLGLAGGVLAWRAVAGSLPIEIAGPGVAPAALLAAPAAIAVANLVAAWPARNAVRTPPADALRAE